MLLVVVSLMMTAFHLIHRMPIVVRLAEGSRLVTNPFNLVAKSQQGAQRACHCRLIRDGSHHLLSHIGNPLPKCQCKCNRSSREGREQYRHRLPHLRPPSDRDGSYSVFGRLEQSQVSCTWFSPIGTSLISTYFVCVASVTMGEMLFTEIPCRKYRDVRTP